MITNHQPGTASTATLPASDGGQARTGTQPSNPQDPFTSRGDELQDDPMRCEDCGHPDNAAMWDADPAYPGLRPGVFFWDAMAPGQADLLSSAFGELRNGREPAFEPVHYSRCDQQCRHDGPVQWQSDAGRPRERWRVARSDVDGHLLGVDEIALAYRYNGQVRASWRAVDIRTLFGTDGLHLERLAVLCLRCLAGRS
jgi:hypothetical protein